MDKPQINTLKEFENICLINNYSKHYHPEKYLKKYNYSINILLNIFCTDYMIMCYEDYYYNDFSLDMIIQYQPHINIDEFKILVKDLDSMIELVKHTELVLELFDKNKSIQIISRWKYESIENYYDNLIKINNNIQFNNIIINDYVNLLQINKYCIINKLYNLDEKIISKEDVIKKAKQIKNILHDLEYSLI